MSQNRKTIIWLVISVFMTCFCVVALITNIRIIRNLSADESYIQEEYGIIADINRYDSINRNGFITVAFNDRYQKFEVQNCNEYKKNQNIKLYTDGEVHSIRKSDVISHHAGLDKYSGFMAVSCLICMALWVLFINSYCGKTKGE